MISGSMTEAAAARIDAVDMLLSVGFLILFPSIIWRESRSADLGWIGWFVASGAASKASGVSVSGIEGVSIPWAKGVSASGVSLGVGRWVGSVAGCSGSAARSLPIGTKGPKMLSISVFQFVYSSKADPCCCSATGSSR